MMKTETIIKVETVQHGFALVVGNKSWLLEDERQLAEAVVFRVALGCKSNVSKGRMRKLLNMLAYGNKEEQEAFIKAATEKRWNWHDAKRRKRPYDRRGASVVSSINQ
jgi:hypothetical protein